MEQYGETRKAAAEAVWQFNKGLMDALCDIVPAVKPQSAYYEAMGWEGMEVLERTIRYAKEKGFFVIADCKRGDIGSTATAYAEAWLGETQVGEQKVRAFDADCVTVNGYMGSDTIKPFLDVCRAEDKCIFVLVKTSNPSSGELQDMVAGDRLVYKVMGDLTQRLGRNGRQQVWLYRGGCRSGRHLSLRPEGPAPAAGEHVLPGARLRRPGWHCRGRAPCLQ